MLTASHIEFLHVSSGSSPVDKLDCKFGHLFFKKRTCKIYFLPPCTSGTECLEPVHMNIMLGEYGILETQLCILEQQFSTGVLQKFI